MIQIQLNGTCSNASEVRLWCGSSSALCSFTGEETVSNTHLSNSSITADPASPYQLWGGVSLALLSSLLIGLSVILKKKALLRLAAAGHTSAGEGGHGYLRDWLWWGGLLTMGAGEVCNFVAYMFAPATLVTPLGALSVIISAVLSSYLLGEVLSVLSQLGGLLCVLGSVMLVLHAPQQQEVTSLQDMTDKLLEPGFLVYVCVVCVCVCVLLYLSLRHGRTSVLIYVSVCSLLGAFTVSSVKGLAIVINTLSSDLLVLANPLTWILLFTLIVSIVTQLNYLNKALDTFGPLLVFPCYYVLFTCVVLLTCAILFQEWRSLSAVGVVSELTAFLVIVVGVAMLHLFKDMQVTLKELTNQMSRPAEGAEPAEETEVDGGGVRERGRSHKEDKCGLMDNMVIHSLPPMREDAPRVFIIS